MMRKIIILLLSVEIIISTKILEAQVPQPSNNFTLDSIKVRVNNIAIDGELSIRGLTADFPYPVLTTITVVDSQNNPIIGLADTARWLSPNEKSQLGITISEIWNPILEYHLDNPSIPTDPNIYNMTPAPLFTEVRETMMVPTSTMLIMDASWSMREEIADTKAGARFFINLMRPVDRAGIIVFNSTIKAYQPMTDDKYQLIAMVNDARAYGFTALYDALMLGIQKTKAENGRRGIIVYADGEDNRSVTTAKAVIDSARTYSIPIFTIALGNETDEDELRRIARRTGGVFSKAATAKEMSEIYERLSGLIHNFYMMAHTSTDPGHNDTWRNVDITVTPPDFVGRGTGRYYVPGFPVYSDISIELNSITDTTIIVDKDTINAIHPGETYEYKIRIRNLGPHIADTLKIYHFLPDSVRMIQSNIVPFSKNENLLVWEFINFNVNREEVILLSVNLARDVPVLLSELTSQVHVVAKNDTLQENNYATDTVKVLFPKIEPVQYTDLSLSLQALSDTTIIINNDTAKAVMRGGNYNYSIKLENIGAYAAQNIRLWQYLPDSVSGSNFNIAPVMQHQDTLFWYFDSLKNGENIEINFNAQVSQEIPFSPFPLRSSVTVSATNDTLLWNNVSAALIYAIKSHEPVSDFTDLSVNITSITDTMVIINSDTTNAVKPGNRFAYQIQVKNLTSIAAVNVKLKQLLPEFVQFIDASVPPIYLSNDSLIWQFDAFEPVEDIAIFVDVGSSLDLPGDLQKLISEVIISAANDTFNVNNVDADTVIILSSHIKPEKFADIKITQETNTDTSINLGNNIYPAVMQGKQYTLSLILENLGPSTGQELSLFHILADSVTASGFNILPTSQHYDTLFWMFDSLSMGEEIVITFNADVSDTLPYAPFPLVNSSFITAKNDTGEENNVATTLVYAIKNLIHLPQDTDLDVSIHSVTDTTVIVNLHTLNAVKPGELYQYQLQLRNLGTNRGVNIRLVQTLPESVYYKNATVPPLISGTDSLVWHFNTFGTENDFKINVTVQLSNIVPENLTELLSRITIFADNDTFPGNNSDFDIVRVISQKKKQDYDLAVIQTALTDTTITVAGQIEQAVLKGDIYQFNIQLKNYGPATAKDIVLWNFISDSVAVNDFNFSPTKRILNTLFWQFSSLAAGDSIFLTYKVKVSEKLEELPFELISASEVMADFDINMQNNFSRTVVYAIPRPGDKLPNLTDISVKQEAVTDSMLLIGQQDTLRFAQQDETYSYTIDVANIGTVSAHQVKLFDFLPDTVIAEDIIPIANIHLTDSIIWYLGYLLPQSSVQVKFTAKTAQKMPYGTNLLINTVRVSAANEDSSLLTNNVDIDTVYHLNRPVETFLPLIEAKPSVVEVGDSIDVRVQVLLPIRNWDIWVYLANGEIDSTYADDFIRSNLILQNKWYNLIPKFSNTRLLTNAKEEKITFEIRTVDIFNEFKSAQASVIVKSSNDLVLDRNVYVASGDDELQVKFKLSSNRLAKLDLYDVVGSYVTKLTEGFYDAGWNVYSWNGITENGKKIGSGLYIITLQSDEYKAWKKIIIVR